MWWIIDQSMPERGNLGMPSLAEAAVKVGHNVFQTSYRPIAKVCEPPIPSWLERPSVGYGTINFCKTLVRNNWAYGNSPLLYFNENVKSWTKFATHLGPYLLNDDYVILPLDEVVRRKMVGMFIKPVSGLKDFTGQVVPSLEEFQFLSYYETLDPSILCVVSKPKEILGEFRYVIAERKVVTGSEYRWDDTLDVRVDTHPACDEMAKTIAELEWQADTVYVCDVALTEGEVAKVIELNAFSSSGLYACDTNKIVEAVAAAALKEANGDPESD